MTTMRVWDENTGVRIRNSPTVQIQLYADILLVGAHNPPMGAEVPT